MADKNSTSAVSESATDPDLENEAAEQTKGSSKTACKTRKGSEIFGLGKGITTADSEITGSRLPTCKQVLRCYLFHKQQGLASRQTKYQTATLVFNQVAEFYNKAHIPMMADIAAIQKIIQLADANARIRAIPVSRRKTPATCAKLQQEESRLSKTFEIWPQNVDKLVTIQEDRLFLESMKTDRCATFGCSDKWNSLTNLEENRLTKGGMMHPNEMDGSVLTLSLGKWMELPGVTFQEWIQDYRERETPTNNNTTKETEGSSCNTRATLGEVAKYYAEYVKTTDVEDNFISRTKVTSVRRLKGRRVINDESGEPEIPCQGCRKFEGDNLFEVKGRHFYSSCGCGQEFTVLTPNVVVATGMLGKPNRLNLEGESQSYVCNSLKDLDNAIQQDVVHSKSDPILVVGAGLNAADAVLCALRQGIPVVHVFRRRADDPELVYSTLPKSVYPEYTQMLTMMKAGSTPDELYTSYAEHNVLEFKPNKTVVLKGPNDEKRALSVSLALVMIGNLPDLSFLPKEGRYLGADKDRPISGRQNPIDVNPFTMESPVEPGLFAIGPLVGDNFVRYAQGGCLALAQHLAIKNGWVQEVQKQDSSDDESDDQEEE